ncbi:MAG: hypothetical protein M3P30_05090 [Chloroflexota bacterium]|nr:hypothetical protein [Chloroflexota bacterium]
MPPIPLLQAVARVTTLDARVVVAALIAFAAVAAALWLPAPVARGFRRGLRRRTIARSALALLVFLAVLPSVLPYDHLLPLAGHSDIGKADQAAHASHCHVSPGTCSDAPVTSGPGQLLMGDPLVATPAMLSILLLLTLPALAGITRRPEIRPPLVTSLA